VTLATAINRAAAPECDGTILFTPNFASPVFRGPVPQAAS
jgi:hypothetical protein